MERGISDEHVRHAIEFPDKLGRSVVSPARFVVKKIYFNEMLAKKHLLMVIYEQSGSEISVVTIIDTSKISKYF